MSHAIDMQAYVRRQRSMAVAVLLGDSAELRRVGRVRDADALRMAALILCQRLPERTESQP